MVCMCALQVRTASLGSATPTRCLSVTMATQMEIPKGWTGRNPLSEADPELQDIIRKEKNRQMTGLELIASEVRVQRSIWNVLLTMTS